MTKKYFTYAILIAINIMMVSCGKQANNENKGFLKQYQATIMSQDEINEYVKDDDSYLKINENKVNFEFLSPESLGLSSISSSQFQSGLSIAQGDDANTMVIFKALVQESIFKVTYNNKISGKPIKTHEGEFNGSASLDIEKHKFLFTLPKSELKNIDEEKESAFIEFRLSDKVASKPGSATVSLKNSKEILITDGDLGKGTYVSLKNLLDNNPNVETIVFSQVDGSIDDKINVETGRMIRQRKLNTKVLENSDIASGAVDLFAAGVKRIYTKGAKIGVHSWCCATDGTPVNKLPKDDKSHYSQLGYFTKMLPKNGYDFYFYTLNAAPAKKIYYMKENEMKKYNLITETL